MKKVLPGKNCIRVSDTVKSGGFHYLCCYPFKTLYTCIILYNFLTNLFRFQVVLMCNVLYVSLKI